MMAPNPSNAGWLLFAVKVHQYQRDRELLACVNGRTRRLICISGGGDRDEELRRSVRERIANGRLFRASGLSVARRGTERPCLVCGRAIEPTSVEREVEDREVIAIAHDDCYRLWREESRRPTA
jgi:hypothetical protein